MTEPKTSRGRPTGKAPKAPKKAAPPAPTPVQEKPRRGRPPDPTRRPLDIEDICEKVASGRSVASVIAEYGRGHGEFWRWLQHPDHPERWELYERARTHRAHLRADEVEVLLDNTECGLIAPDIARVVLDGKKWVTAKLYPRVYADRQNVEHTGQVSLVQALAELNGVDVPKRP